VCFNLLVDGVRKGQQLCFLERLALKGCGLHPQDVKEMMAPVLSATKCIKLLSLEKNRVTDDTVIALAASEFLNRVESLNVRFNNIGNDGAKAIAASPNIQSLKVLNFKQNKVTDVGAAALASMLRDNQSLRLLNLRRQTPPLTDKAAFAFAESLRDNPSALQQLRLRRNRITDAGAVALAAAGGDRMTRLCKQLYPWDLRLELDLEENRIGDKGAVALLAMAAKCPTSMRLEVLLCSNQTSRDSLCSAVMDAGEQLDAMDKRVRFLTKPEGGL
jgi:Leucine-rich repeat (LRR) protein